jgi:hypothetical protein
MEAKELFFIGWTDFAVLSQQIDKRLYHIEMSILLPPSMGVFLSHCCYKLALSLSELRFRFWDFCLGGTWDMVGE